jgi:predicted AlkP superfamily phosphohydrolase/phosphomutase
VSSRHTSPRWAAAWVGVAVLMGACEAPPVDRGRLIILGVDGMDPVFTQRLIDAGLVPNLAKLSLAPLATTWPPQSPVAWSSFITGVSPAGHGIFDFVHRDADDYGTYLSTSRATSDERVLPLGPFALPLFGGEVELQRAGRPFWEALAAEGIAATVSKVPAHYPPPDPGLDHLEVVAGMGTPDLLGTYGTFTILTDAPKLAGHRTAHGRWSPLVPKEGALVAALEGPPNPYRQDQALLSAEVEVLIDDNGRGAAITIGDETVALRVGEWSRWLPVAFDPGALAPDIVGAVRVLVRSVSPRVTVYVSPINLDPLAPAQTVSSPADAISAMAARVGRFYTQGMPGDTDGVVEGALDDEAFLDQADLIWQERERALDDALQRTPSGLVFHYLPSVDQTSHLYFPEDDAPIVSSHPVVAQYLRVDRLVGRLLPHLEDDEALLVMSDHGFARLKARVGLNRWLADEGWLRFAPEGGVDWAQTKVYALGLNQLFINRQGREAQGQVDDEEATALLDDVERRLLALRDPVTGAAMVTALHRPATGAHPERQPDAVIGFARGYGMSTRSALLERDPVVRVPVVTAWRADHCMDPSAVPGVRMSSRPLGEAAGLMDLGELVLRFFKIDTPSTTRRP